MWPRTPQKATDAWLCALANWSNHLETWAAVPFCTKNCYGAGLGSPLNPWWGGVGTWGHNPMPPWPQLAHQSWHATGGGN